MKTFLFTVSYLIDVEDDFQLGTEEGDKFERLVMHTLSKDPGEKIDDTNFAKWAQCRYGILDTQTMNCGKCGKCGAWTSDREKEDPIRELQIGATVEGVLLCDEHLPKGHRWAF